METAGEWLEKALIDLCNRVETGLQLDKDIISGLVSYCDLAQPQDAKDYLDNIIGEEAGKGVIEEYLQRRGYSDPRSSSSAAQTLTFQAYVKPSAEKWSDTGNKKPKEANSVKVTVPVHQTDPKKSNVSSHTQNTVSTESKGNNNKKKKSGKVVSLAEAAKGSIVFRKGNPCSCQARRHRLVSNCLSCGKIVCEQEGEGPCSFCGALVLKEGSTYAGLEEGFAVPLSDTEVAAEAYAKRLVDYDRNSAARTTVFDDQSDYYEFESNNWLSKEEKELLKKKQEEMEAEEKAKRSRVVVTFDLVGRKVLLNQGETSDQEPENDRIVTPPSEREREANRIKPSPNLRIQPIFLDSSLSSNKKPAKSEQPSKTLPNGLCLESTGRVQHNRNELMEHFAMESDAGDSS